MVEGFEEQDKGNNASMARLSERLRESDLID